MPLKTIIIILALVGVGALLKPDWALIFIWGGGMALLWMITGQWQPPAKHKKAGDVADESEDIRPGDASMEADDIDDLTRLDGEIMDAPHVQDRPNQDGANTDSRAGTKLG